MSASAHLFCLLFAVMLLSPGTRAAAQTEIRPRDEADGCDFLFHGGVSGLFDSEKNPALALEHRWARVSDLELRPWLGAGWATDGAVFVAVGVARSWRMDDRWRLCAGFGPAYYDRHEGLDLGSSLEFYSFIEMECRAGGAHGVVFRLAHISNGGVADSNPGTELLTLGYRIRLP